MLLEHMPKHGAALAALTEAVTIVAREMTAAHLDVPAACARAGLTVSVMLRFLEQRVATAHTLACLERAFNVSLPRPRAELFFLIALRARWCGYEYEITGPSGPLTGWHTGSEAQVRDYAHRVIARAHRVSTVIV